MSILDSNIVDNANQKALIGLPVMLNDQKSIVLDADGGKIKLIGKFIQVSHRHTDINDIVEVFGKTGWILPSNHEFNQLFGKTKAEAYANFQPIIRRGYLPTIYDYLINKDCIRFITSTPYKYVVHYGGEPHKALGIYVYCIGSNNNPIVANWAAIEPILDNSDEQLQISALLIKKCGDEENKQIQIDLPQTT